jgi:hypothetical protein
VWTAGIARADLAAALGAKQRQFCTASRAQGVVLADGCAAAWTERPSTGRTFRHTERDSRIAKGASNAPLKLAARADALFGKKYQIAARTEFRPTLQTKPFRRQDVGSADRADRPTHEHSPDPLGQAAGRGALMVCHWLPTVGTEIGSAKKRLATGRTATGKNKPTVRADLGAGKKFHLASRANKDKFEAAPRTAFDTFVHRSATARAERPSAGSTEGITEVDVGTAERANQITGLPRTRLGFRFNRVAAVVSHPHPPSRQTPPSCCASPGRGCPASRSARSQDSDETRSGS